jgi:serine/threonine protein kinase
MSYEVVRLICNTKNCTVHEIKYYSSNIRACAKTLKFSEAGRQNNIIKEAINLASIKDIPLALQLYECKLIKKNNNPNDDTFCIITEYCSNGNLENYMKIRQKYNMIYSFIELKKIFSEFINFFANLQRRNMAHRDIKPENIYVNEDFEFRVGDMGSSKIINMESINHTIVGTENYLSPELRKGYAQYRSRVAGLYMELNYFKSDVFSLGLVFLNLIQMKKLDTDMDDLKNVQDLIFNEIKSINFKSFQILLTIMLKFNPQERPDFLILEAEFKKLFSTVSCCSCHIDNGNSVVNCSICEMSFHINCLLNDECPNCSNKILKNCSNCQNSRVLKCSTHQLCENCSILNIECAECIGFELSTGRADNFNFPVSRFKCFACDNTLDPSPENGLVICSRCNTSWCKYCKREAHPRLSCVQNFKILNIFCHCERRITRSLLGIFVFCETCRLEFCVVCLDHSAKSHLRCAQVLNKIVNA